MTLVMTFIVYSVIGWLWETFYCSLKDRRFVFRGFLLGPYCPVYGFGVVAVLLLVPDSGSLLTLYFNSLVIVTVIEFIGSWFLERFFNMKLWDYSSLPFNIEGRVAVPVSLFWGIGCLVLIKGINPVIQNAIGDFIDDTKGIGPWLILLIFLTDLVSTFIFTVSTKKEVRDLIDDSDQENAAVKEFRLKQLFTNRAPRPNRQKVLQFLNDHPLKWRHYNLRRIIKNYPNIKLTKRILKK
ncbi:putative ABC transporter permease [Lactococcus taiwanensis]|uniref:putative ABC transporter permease n=1 Tax=Lactococcus taiwanensis TaxID=1151742 RepID=UPI00289AB8C7|nr:hypothetical protein [Lactococcus taiwanensis]